MNPYDDQGKAGQLFRCVCCKADTPDHEAIYDKCLDGPVCQQCLGLLAGAEAQLKEAGYSKCSRLNNRRIQ